jgi:Arc/MetJ family transcription regulator
MTTPAVHHDRRRGDRPTTRSPEDVQSPSVLHIDVAEAVRQVQVAPLPPVLKRDPMDTVLLEEAARCAGYDLSVMPRRELVAVALREAVRERAWRDQAEQQAVELTQRGNDALDQLEEAVEACNALHAERQQLLGILFELVAWCAPRLHCAPSSEDVLARIRALGSGFIQHQPLPRILAMDGGVTETEADHA